MGSHGAGAGLSINFSNAYPTMSHELLHHVLIYGLGLFVVCVCVCVCVRAVCMCACLGALQFLQLGRQACNGSHTESNAVVTKRRPGQQTCP